MYSESSGVVQVLSDRNIQKFYQIPYFLLIPDFSEVQFCRHPVEVFCGKQVPNKCNFFIVFIILFIILYLLFYYIYHFHQKCGIVRLVSSSSIGRVLVLVDSVLHLLRARTLERVSVATKLKDVSAFCVNNNPTSGDPFVLEVR